MKAKKIKIIIRSSDQLKSEMIEALKGSKRSIQKENEIIFNSVKSMMAILTSSRLEVLIYLTKHRPQSIYELAKGLGRDFKNVHSDVKKLSELDLIGLEPTGNSRKGLIPRAKYTGIEFSLAA